MNFVRKNAPPATAEQLRANAGPMRAEVERLRAEIRGISSTLADLVGDPEEFAKAQAALREAQILLPMKEAALEAVEAAIPVAESREAREAFRAEVAALSARTAKFKRGLPERYNAAAQALAAVLRDMEANAEEWRQLNFRAQQLGEPAGDDAERDLRRELPVNAGGWSRIWADLDVPAWDGRLLFEGRANQQRFA